MSEQKELQKFLFEHLYLELTRKCNLRCEHCLCGEPQDITISCETIDKFLDQTLGITHLTIGGGEPLLELDMLQYLLESITQRSIPVTQIELISNGTIFDEKVMQIISRYLESNPISNFDLTFSSDRFHDKERSIKCVSFYRDIAAYRCNVSLNKDIETLVEDGRSRDKAEVQGVPVRGIAGSSIRQHRIKLKGNRISCLMMLTVKGGLLFFSETSYENRDRLAIGNMLTDSFEEMIKKNEQECPYLCDECNNETKLINYEKHWFKDKSIKDEIDKANAARAKKHIEFIWQLRQWAFKRFPNVRREAIIMGTIISFSDFMEYVKKYLIQLYKNVNKIKSDEEAKQRMSLDAYIKYNASIKMKFPKAEEKDVILLSTEKYFLGALDQMTVDDFKLALFEGNTADSYFLSVEQRLKQHGEDVDDFDPCSKIPDTLDLN